MGIDLTLVLQSVTADIALAVVPDIVENYEWPV
jgi:hypothetical protein